MQTSSTTSHTENSSSEAEKNSSEVSEQISEEVKEAIVCRLRVLKLIVKGGVEVPENRKQA